MRKVIFPGVYLFLLVLAAFIFGFTANSFLNSKATSAARLGHVSSIRYIPVGKYSEQRLNETLHEFTFKRGFKITHTTSTYIILER